MIFLFLIGAGLIFAGARAWANPSTPKLPPVPSRLPASVTRWWSLIVKYSNMFNLDPYLVASIINKESGGDPNARNPESTATGLMQLIYNTARSVGVPEPVGQYLLNPEWNIWAGCKYLSQLMAKYKDTWKAVYAYYAGTYPSSKYGARATNYANTVVALYTNIREVYYG